MINLRPYQTQAVKAVIDSYNKGIKKVGIVMAVGSGKTITFCSVIKKMIDETGKQALILAHREELLNQAAHDLKLVAPELSSSIEQGENIAKMDANVIIASVPTLGRSSSDRIKKFDPDKFCCIVVDEMHHFTNSTYTNIFKHFHTLKNIDDNNKILLLGVTATGFRSDNQKLEDIIEDIVFEYNIITGIKQKYLSNLKAFTIKTNIDISKVKKSGEDFNITDLGRAVNRDSRNKIVLSTFQQNKSKQTLIFAVNVQHAIDLTNIFKLAGVKAEYVVGTTKKEKRKKIVNDFSNKKINVLINVGVFTEGTNIPSIEAIIMARPTQSLGLYYQMIGRSTRLFEGKTHADIYDIVDNTGRQGIKTISSLIGVNGNLDFKGKDLIEIKNFVDKLRNLSPNVQWDKVDVNNMRKEIKRLDLIAGLCVPPELNILTDFAWSKLANGLYKIGLGKNKNSNLIMSMYLRENAIGKYEIYMNTFNQYERKTIRIKLSTKNNIREAINFADKKIRKSFSNRFGLIKRNAHWRSTTPTPKQIQVLRKLKISNNILKQLDKGQASFLLDKLFEEKPKKKLTPKQKAYLRWKGKF